MILSIALRNPDEFQRKGLRCLLGAVALRKGGRRWLWSEGSGPFLVQNNWEKESSSPPRLHSAEHQWEVLHEVIAVKQNHVLISNSTLKLVVFSVGQVNSQGKTMYVGTERPQQTSPSPYEYSECLWHYGNTLLHSHRYPRRPAAAVSSWGWPSPPAHLWMAVWWHSWSSSDVLWSEMWGARLSLWHSVRFQVW